MSSTMPDAGASTLLLAGRMQGLGKAVLIVSGLDHSVVQLHHFPAKQLEGLLRRLLSRTPGIDSNWLENGVAARQNDPRHLGWGGLSLTQRSMLWKRLAFCMCECVYFTHSVILKGQCFP